MPVRLLAVRKKPVEVAGTNAGSRSRAVIASTSAPSRTASSSAHRSAAALAGDPSTPTTMVLVEFSTAFLHIGSGTVRPFATPTVVGALRIRQ